MNGGEVTTRWGGGEEMSENREVEEGREWEGWG